MGLSPYCRPPLATLTFQLPMLELLQFVVGVLIAGGAMFLFYEFTQTF
jgi:hypothetical protein